MSDNKSVPRERMKYNDWRIGHHPDEPQTIENWVFRRCFCGFLLIMTPAGDVWWLRARNTTQKIESLDGLYRALSTHCQYYKRPDQRRSALNAELEAAQKEIKELTALKNPASKTAPAHPTPTQPAPKAAPPSLKPAFI